MRWPNATIALILACGPIYPNQVAAQPGQASSQALVTQVRAFFALQDAAANGDEEAIRQQDDLLAQINAKRIGNELLSEPGTATAIAGYVLSGGHPELAEMASTSEGLDAQSRQLLTGAALYMRGKTAEAATELKGINALRLPPLIAGRVALVQAILVSDSPAEKQRLFAIAIAAMPGTLIEESALRRSALAYGQAGDQKSFWLRSERYIRRFRSSPYAPEFLSAWVLQIVAFEAGAKDANIEKCQGLAANLPIAQRRSLYVQLMRQAARRNLAKLAQFAARQLRKISDAGSAEAALADLYESIFDVAGASSKDIGETLSRINRNLLDASERDLLDAALIVLRQIREPLPASAATDALGKLAGPAALPKSGLELRAERAISDATQLIEETAK